MPHADAAAIPETVKTKAELWDFIYTSLAGLLEGQRSWVTNCANASSLIYHSLLAAKDHFGENERAVNWCGFYIRSHFFPVPRYARTSTSASEAGRLLLGPFCGKPACQFINITPDKARGVCAEAFLRGQTVVVTDVEAYPGHIACDGDTKSELVSPLILSSGEETTVLGVLDLDCLALEGFDDDDKKGIERIAKLVVDACDW